MANEISIIVSAQDKTAAGFTSAAANQRKLADATKATGQEYERTQQKATGFGASLKRIGEVAAGVLVADVLQSAARKAQALMHETVKAASDLGESVNAVNKVFGAASEQVQKWGQDNANAIGLSTRAFNQMATPLGSMLKNQGLALDQVTDHTIKLTQRAADMASVFNTDVTEALAAIQAGLRGEQDPLERYGVSLSAVSVEARALADSHKTSSAQLTAQEKALARLNLIYDQTADTAGDFRDTATGLANAQRIATATMEDAKAKIGTVFIPVMAQAAQLTGAFAEKLTALPQPVIVGAAAVAGLAAATALLAPRVIASKEALDRMATSDSALQRGMSKTVGVVGRVAAGLTAVSLAAVAVNAAVGGGGANVQVDALAESLAGVAKNGLNAGEGVRVFGSDLEQLQYDLGTLGSGFWAELGNGIAGVAETFGDFGRDDSLTKAKERIAGVDTALATLVRAGRAEEAAGAFKFLSDQATVAGISVDDLKAGMPQYAAAIQVAAAGTNALATAGGKAADEISVLKGEIDKFIAGPLALEEAEDNAAEAIERLREQIKEQKKDHEAGAGALSGNTQAARDNREAVRDLVEMYGGLIEKERAAGRSTEGLVTDLENQLVGMSLSRAEVERYMGQLKNLAAAIAAIPTSKTVTIKVRATGGASYRVEGATGDLLGGMEHGGISGAGSSWPGMASAASGGQRGGWTLTGEKGPELVRLPYGSNVIPAGTTRNMLSGGGDGGVVWASPFVYNGSSRYGAALIEDIRTEVAARGGTLAVLGLRS